MKAHRRGPGRVRGRDGPRGASGRADPGPGRGRGPRRPPLDALTARGPADPIDASATDERGPEPPAGLRAYRFVFKEEEHLVLSFPVAAASLPDQLTDAERVVLRELLAGKRNAEIARSRGTSPRTVANQISSLYRKLGVASRAEIAARFGAAL